MKPIEFFIKSYANLISILKPLTEEGYQVLVSYDKHSSLFHIKAIQASENIIKFEIDENF